MNCLPQMSVVKSCDRCFQSGQGFQVDFINTIVIPLEFTKCSRVISAVEVVFHNKSAVRIFFLGQCSFLNVSPSETTFYPQGE
jgi:hypothetical protein